MLAPLHDLNGRHLTTAHWDRGGEWNIRRLAEEELREILERDFHAYVTRLENVMAFKYLSRVMTADFEYWP